MNIDTNKLAETVGWMLKELDVEDADALRNLLAVIKQQAEVLNGCYVELQYCEQQIRNSRGDYRKRQDMWNEPGSVMDSLRAARTALAASAPLVKLVEGV